MRHSSTDITVSICTDASLPDVAVAIVALPGLPLRKASPPTTALRARHIASRREALEPLTRRVLDVVPTDQCSADCEERFVDLGEPLVADAQASELAEPCQRPFHDPAEPAQPVVGSPTMLGDLRLDAPTPQLCVNAARIVRLVGTNEHGLLRGLPAHRGGRWMGGTASTRSMATWPSFVLADVSMTASGTPCPSVSRWRLLPALALSVGFGPVCRCGPQVHRHSGDVRAQHFPFPRVVHRTIVTAR